jgi:hypothetical protein
MSGKTNRFTERNKMNALMEAPAQAARPTSAEPEIYQEGDCWRFRWAGRDHGSFDSEQGAISAALRCKRLSILHLAAAALDRH